MIHMAQRNCIENCKIYRKLELYNHYKFKAQHCHDIINYLRLIRVILVDLEFFTGI